MTKLTVNYTINSFLERLEMSSFSFGSSESICIGKPGVIVNAIRKDSRNSVWTHFTSSQANMVKSCSPSSRSGRQGSAFRAVRAHTPSVGDVCCVKGSTGLNPVIWSFSHHWVTPQHSFSEIPSPFSRLPLSSVWSNITGQMFVTIYIPTYSMHPKYDLHQALIQNNNMMSQFRRWTIRMSKGLQENMIPCVLSWLWEGLRGLPAFSFTMTS